MENNDEDESEELEEIYNVDWKADTPGKEAGAEGMDRNSTEESTTHIAGEGKVAASCSGQCHGCERQTVTDKPKQPWEICDIWRQEGAVMIMEAIANSENRVKLQIVKSERNRACTSFVNGHAERHG